MPSWKRTFRAVWAANLVTSVAMMSFLPFFPSLLEEMGLQDERAIAAWSGAIFGAAPLSATFMSPVWGALGDRFGRRMMVIRAMLALSIFVGAMYFARTPLQLFLLRLAQGLFSGFIPPSITLVSVAAPPERQGRVVADLQTALPLGAVLGPFLGGLFAMSDDQRAVFLFVAAAGFVSATLVWSFAHEESAARRPQRAGGSPRGVARQTLRDLAELGRNRALRATALLVLCLQFGLGATNPVLELYVEDLLGPQPSGRWVELLARVTTIDASDPAVVLALATSVLFGGMAFVNLACMPVWGRLGDRFGHRSALVAAAGGCALALGLQAAAPLYMVLLLGRLLLGLALAGTGPLAFGVAAVETSVDQRGGAFGLVFGARTLSIALGGMLGGALSAWIGIRSVMAGSALLVCLAVYLFRRSRPGVGDVGGS